MGWSDYEHFLETASLSTVIGMFRGNKKWQKDMTFLICLQNLLWNVYLFVLSCNNGLYASLVQTADKELWMLRISFAINYLLSSILSLMVSWYLKKYGKNFWDTSWRSSFVLFMNKWYVSVAHILT